MWQYEDAMGIIRAGEYAGSSSGQGSDVTYFFKRGDGIIDCVSGRRLKEAKRVPVTQANKE